VTDRLIQLEPSPNRLIATLFLLGPLNPVGLALISYSTIVDAGFWSCGGETVLWLINAPMSLAAIIAYPDLSSKRMSIRKLRLILARTMQSVLMIYPLLFFLGLALRQTGWEGIQSFVTNASLGDWLSLPPAALYAGALALGFGWVIGIIIALPFQFVAYQVLKRMVFRSSRPHI